MSSHHGSGNSGSAGHPIVPAGQSIPADVTKMGYLKKLKTMKKKFFIVRSGSRFHPPRLEYFDSEKKFRAGLPAKRTIDLSECFSVNKRVDSKHKCGIIVYTKDDSFSILADNAEDQDDWFNEILEAFTEGICDTEHAKHYDCVWPVTVQNKGLGNTRCLAGHYRLCLSDQAVSMVKLNAVKPEVVFQLRLIRRCGHSNGVFFMEVGRSSITGEGELSMAVEDTAMAQAMHDAILTAMKNPSSSDRIISGPISVPQGAHDPPRPRTTSVVSPRRPEDVPDRPRPMSMFAKSPPGSTSRSTSALMSSHFVASQLSPESCTDDNRLRSNSMESRESRSGASSALSCDASDCSPIDHHINSHFGGRVGTPESTHQPIAEYMAMTPGNSSNGSSRERLDSVGSSVPDAGAVIVSYMEMTPGESGNPTVTSAPSSSQQKDTYIDMSPLASDPLTPTMTGTDDSYAFMGGSRRGSNSLKSGPGSHKSGPGSYKSGPGSYKSGPGSCKSGPGSYKSGPGSYKSGPSSHKSGPSSVKSMSSVEGRDDGYIDMEPGSETMSPCVDFSSPGYFSMTSSDANSKLGTMGEMRPDKVYSYLSDDSFNGDTLPIRTYSVGSKTTMTKPTLTYQAYQETVARQGKLSNSKSSSAPHLIPQKGRPLQNETPSPVIPYVNTPCSPMSKSFKSDDSDSFMELDFCRPRTASDSYSYRRRTGSFGQAQAPSSNYTHPTFRERSSSHGQSSKPIMLKRISSESVRTTSQELLRKASMDSLHRSSRESLRSSQESLRKAVLDNRSRSALQTDYMEMSPDKASSSSAHRKPSFLSTKKQSKGEGSKSAQEYFDMTLGSPTQSFMHSHIMSSGTVSPTPTSPVMVKLTAPDTYMEMEPGQVTSSKANKNEQNQKAADMHAASALRNPVVNPYMNISYEKEGAKEGHSSKQKGAHGQGHGHAKQTTFVHVRQASSPASLETHQAKSSSANAAAKSLSPDSALYSHQHPLSRSMQKPKSPIPRSPLAGDENDAYLSFAPGHLSDDQKKAESKKQPQPQYGQKRNSKLQPKSPEILREESDSSYMSFSSDGSLSDSKNSDIWLPRNKHRIKSGHGKSETVREESDGYISFSPVNVQGEDEAPIPEEPKVHTGSHRKYHPKFDYRKDAQKSKKSTIPKISKPDQDYMSFAPSIVVECEPIQETSPSDKQDSLTDQSNLKFKSGLISSNIVASSGSVQASAPSTDEDKAYMEFSPVGASSDKETSNKVSKKKHSGEHAQRRTKKVSSGSRSRSSQSEGAGQETEASAPSPSSPKNTDYANMSFPEGSAAPGKNTASPVTRPTFDPSKVPKGSKSETSSEQRGSVKSPRCSGQRNAKDSSSAGRVSQGALSVSPRERLRKASGDSNKGSSLESGSASLGVTNVASQGKLPKRGSTPNIPSYADKSGVAGGSVVGSMLPGDRHSYSEPSTSSDLTVTGSLTPGSATSSRHSSRTSLNSIASKDTLNYASLDLGSSDNVTGGEGGITFLSASSSATQSPSVGKIRHGSGVQESQDPPPFYAEIDFKKCEELKNAKR